MFYVEVSLSILGRADVTVANRYNKVICDRSTNSKLQGHCPKAVALSICPEHQWCAILNHSFLLLGDLRSIIHT
jgi:hypothetical protein